MKEHVALQAIQILKDDEPKHYMVHSPNKALSGDLQIDLLNAGGKVVPSHIQYWQLNLHTYQVNLSSLPVGVYHLRVMNHNTYFVKRIILQ